MVHPIQFSSQKEADDHYAAAVAATPFESAKKTKVGVDRPRTIQQREALKKPRELCHNYLKQS
jgi:hypothetical protein